MNFVAERDVNVVSFPHRKVERTLWWPRDCLSLGLSPGARECAEAWIIDLKSKIDLKIGQAIYFRCEDVIESFDLTVFPDGSYRTDPDVINVPVKATITTHIGHSAQSIDGILAQCAGCQEQSFRCRVGITSILRMRYLYRNG